MDQKKTGLFLKELRKEKSLTQEQLAEQFMVSSRSVSRWETGTNLPDLSILVELADFYNIDIREIIDGERKNEMNKETKETLNKVAEYTEMEKKQIRRRMIDNLIGTSILLIFCGLLLVTDGFGGFIAARPFKNIVGFTLGVALAINAMTAIYLSGNMDKVTAFKKKLLGR